MNSAVDKEAKVSSVLQRWFVYVCYLGPTDTIRPQLLGRAETKRMDKQPGAGNTAAGTTSLVNKGSAPSLIGFALEHGGLTQDVNGNTITFRGNLINSIRALQAGSYMGAFDMGNNDPLVTYLAKLSFGVSFDTSANQGSSTQGFAFDRNTFSGVSAKYELYNHRDPRDQKWRRRWNGLAANAGVELASQFGHLDAAIRRNSRYDHWLSSNRDAILALPPGASDGDIQNALETAIKTFGDNFGSVPEVKQALDRFTAAIPDYIKAADTVFGDIKRTPIVTLDYNFVRQSLPTGQTVTTTQPGQSLPDLSNLSLVLERGFAGDSSPELTFNASGTWFSGSAAGRGRVRDYRASLQLDVPLREIQQIGKPTLSFSGQYLHLLQEPLGQQVTLNGVTISRTGGIGIFQTKLSVPVKDSGIKIPISFTYSNRTELIKEKDVRGNVGITFDMDTLFAKSK
ncbi:MAG: hypothetical protein LAP21_18830 [Acidobacteriia bacterium]|nr:hypothetical protein [Terriglobia bacterium]